MYTQVATASVTIKPSAIHQCINRTADRASRSFPSSTHLTAPSEPPTQHTSLSANSSRRMSTQGLRSRNITKADGNRVTPLSKHHVSPVLHTFPSLLEALNIQSMWLQHFAMFGEHQEAAFYLYMQPSPSSQRNETALVHTHVAPALARLRRARLRSLSLQPHHDSVISGSQRTVEVPKCKIVAFRSV